MLNLTNNILNVHRFKRHKPDKNQPKKYENLGTWRYTATFKHCYPNIPQILTSQYGLRPDEKIIVYVTKEIRLPHFNRYRTRFKKVFHGTLTEYEAHLKKLLRKGKKDLQSGGPTRAKPLGKIKP